MSRSHEVATLRSVQRVLSGRGEELDLLLVRTALVELMRDQIKTKRTVVLLFHLRRQLGLSPPRGGKERLSGVLGPGLSTFDSALGWYELARLNLDAYYGESELAQKNELAPEKGQADLDRALSFAWEPNLRSEILFYRGMIALENEYFGEALRDFSAVRRLGVSGTWLKNAYLGESLSHLARGDDVRAIRAARLAVDWDRRTTRANDAPVFDVFPLGDAHRAIVELVLETAPSQKYPPHFEDWILDEEQCSALPLSEKLTAPYSVIAYRLANACLSIPEQTDTSEP